MGWPFVAAVFSFDTGIFAVNVGAPVSKETAVVYLMGMRFTNASATDSAFVTVTDTAGGSVLDTQEIPPKSSWQVPGNLEPLTGIKVGASAAVSGRLWGWK